MGDVRAGPAPGHRYAFCCETCDDNDPHWRLTRIGDVVTTWACDTHLAAALDGLQRDYEVTEVVVTDMRKALEWAGIARTLAEIADGKQ